MRCGWSGVGKSPHCLGSRWERCALISVRRVLIAVLKCRVLNSFSAEGNMLRAVIDVESALLSFLVNNFLNV